MTGGTKVSVLRFPTFASIAVIQSSWSSCCQPEIRKLHKTTDKSKRPFSPKAGTLLKPVCQALLLPEEKCLCSPPAPPSVFRFLASASPGQDYLSTVVLSLPTPKKLGKAYERIGRGVEQKEKTAKTYGRRGIICRKETVYI